MEGRVPVNVFELSRKYKNSVRLPMDSGMKPPTLFPVRSSLVTSPAAQVMPYLEQDPSGGAGGK